MSVKNTLPPPSEISEIHQIMFSDRCKDDPLFWVMYAFPWGKKGTPLAGFKGPKEWQRQELKQIATFIQENKARMARGEQPQIYQSATASGRGIGKSALVSWLALWHLSTKLGAPSIVSANTASQLQTTTFAEVGKWQTLMINNRWYERNQTSVSPAPWFKKLMKDDLGIDDQYYYIDGKLWNEDDPHSFAGPHSGYGMQVIFDEASGIPQNIWDITDFFFTDKSPYMFWHVFANPRSNTGAFFECFHSKRDRWYTRNIDAREVEDINHTKHHETVKEHGEDSDKARIEVRGEFPKQGDRQFISRGIVADAVARQLEKYDDYAALLMGVDPARFGDDSTVIRFRRGRDARSIPPVKLQGADNMAVANKCAHLIDTFDPDGVFIDAGAGAGIIDRLKEMGYRIFEVNFGSASNSPECFDHRTELWTKMRDWIPGSMLDNDRDLIDDLCGPEYEFMGREDKLKLESKEKMKKRGLHSPDDADALAVTFHAKVARRNINASRKSTTRKPRTYGGVGADVEFG